MKSEQLHIQMFGEFHMKNDYHQFIPSSSKGTQVTTLITYLIANKDVEISKDKLVDILWPEEEIANPTGALRNLVYRARQELALFFPVSHANCILFKRNAYMWNKAVDCVTDIDRFESLSNQAQKEAPRKNGFAATRKCSGSIRGIFFPPRIGTNGLCSEASTIKTYTSNVC